MLTTQAAQQEDQAWAQEAKNSKVASLKALHCRPARPIAKRKKAALGRPSEHLEAYFCYRCSTRSLISCVRPWFQNCVPM